MIRDAADDISINDPLNTSGGAVTLIARGDDGGSTLTIGAFGNTSDDGIITTDGAGNGGAVTITADNLVLTGTRDPIIAADGVGGVVTIQPFTAGRPIDLGTETAGSVSITEANIDRIAADTLRFGSATSGSITISDAISPAQASTLSLITGGSIVDGNATGVDLTVANLALQAGTGIGTAANPLETAVSNLAFNNNGGVVGVNNSGAVTIAALDGLASSSSIGNATIAATEIGVGNGVPVNVTGTLAFNASTVNLDGNLTATGGISGMATTVNVLGSTGGAEIQDAVDVAVPGATINVAAGSYSSFIIDKANLTVAGAGATTIINAASPAITVSANSTTVQDMLLQGTGAVDDVGILLDGTAAPNLTGVQIINVDFSNLDDGVRSQGDIGVGGSPDVTIRGTDAMNPAIFEDFLDAAIDVGDTDGDAVYLVQDAIVRDGAADGDTVATGGDGFRFGAVGGITANRVDISGATGDGIQFGALDDASVTVSSSSIVGALDAAGSGSGLNFDGFITNGSQISIAGNSRIESLGGQHGIEFEQAPTGATTFIDIANNTLIQSSENQGIVFARGATDVTVIIRGNGTNASNGIRGPTDAISVNNSVLTNVNFLVGGDTAADGNFISSTAQALDIQGITGGRFVVANNDLLQGSAAVEFEGAVTNGAEVVLVNNGDIRSTGAGVQFRGNVTDSMVTIGGNSFTDVNGNAIVFLAGQAITDSTVIIGSATVTVDAANDVVAGGNTIDGSGSGSGIVVRAAVDGDTNFTITDNTIGANAAPVGVDGIAFTAGILDTATVTIGSGNTVFATDRAIDIDDLQSPSTLSITGGTYNATGGALRVDNTGVAGTDGRLNVGAANFVAGAGGTVFEVLTDSGNAGVDIDFSGAATFDGGATGIRLSRPRHRCAG